jgi:hypothetical protein
MKKVSCLLLLIVLASAGSASADISGTISYTGASTAPIHVFTSTDPTFDDEDEMTYVTLDSPGGYTLTGLADGTYYIVAMISNIDDDEDIKKTDPWGLYGTWGNLTPVTITGGSNVSGIDISLVDGTEENPNPYYEKYSIELWSSNWHYGESYLVDFKVSDPDHEVTSVDVTGPGITTPFILVYDNDEKIWRRTEDRLVNFHNSPPTPPLIYTFTIVDPSSTTVETDTVESFLSEYATKLSPSGGETITGSLVFSWTWDYPDYTYWVKLHDAEGNQIWDAYDLTVESVIYDGQVLTSGAEYHYEVAVEDGYGNLSHAEESFVYQATPADPTTASVGTYHYYPETLFPGMSEYEVSFTVRGSEISSVTVEGPNISSTSLDNTQSTSGEWRWNKHVGLSVKPTVGDTYTLHVTYNNSTTEDFTDSVTGVIEEFPTIFSPVHGSTIATTTPTFEWSALTIDLSKLSIMVVDSDEGRFLWMGDGLKGETSVEYNIDGKGEPLQSGKKYIWAVLYRDASDDNGAFVFGEFTVYEGSISVEEDIHPSVFNVSQNYPNPFNPVTTLEYAVPAGTDDRITLKVYNMRGTMVNTLVDHVESPGVHSVVWDGRDYAGNTMSSGVYIYRLKAGNFVQSNKMMLMR